MASACGGDQLRRAAMIEKAAAVYVCVYVVLKSVIVVGRHGRALALLHDSGASLAATNARLGTTANESPAFSGCKPSWRQKRGHGGWSGPARPHPFLPSARPWFVWFHPRHGHREIVGRGCPGKRRGRALRQGLSRLAVGGAGKGVEK
jgi:hypothetical protein